MKSILEPSGLIAYVRAPADGVPAAAFSEFVADTFAAGTLSAGFEHPHTSRTGPITSKFLRLFIIRLEWGEFPLLANVVFSSCDRQLPRILWTNQSSLSAESSGQTNHEPCRHYHCHRQRQDWSRRPNHQ